MLKSVLGYCNQQMEAAPETVPSVGVPGLCGLCCSCCQQQEQESLLPSWFSGVCPEKQAKPFKVEKVVTIHSNLLILKEMGVRKQF